ncbi:hypothetical protein N7522_002216 [Penicillium canescens]|nr:hypothetical protein N7522_002216 [Penicillium canescens]KAJ6059532.1 hypothetical protein N7444_003171 [Penicillium canescens]
MRETVIRPYPPAPLSGDSRYPFRAHAVDVQLLPLTGSSQTATHNTNNNTNLNLISLPLPPRRGPIEGPNGRRLIRRVTWRSSTYKLMASLWVLAVLYIVWLVRDLFYLPVPPAESAPPQRE